MAAVCPGHEVDELTISLLNIFEARSLSFVLLEALIKQEVEDTGSSSSSTPTPNPYSPCLLSVRIADRANCLFKRTSRNCSDERVWRLRCSPSMPSGKGPAISGPL